MIGVELKLAADIISDRCNKKGLLVNVIQENILRFLPSLTIQISDIDSACVIIESVLKGEFND